MKRNLFILIILAGLFFSCEPKVQVVTPPSVFEYEVASIPGGGRITYRIPNDRSIAYVLAKYERNGKVFTERSSIYKNIIIIEGFASMDSIPVTLYTVDEEENLSEPINVKIAPLEAPIFQIKKSLRMIPDFGGITAQWENETGTEIGLRFFVNDLSKENVMKDTLLYYSVIRKEEHVFGRFDAVERTFGISIEDKWGNITDTTMITATPLFEIELEKPFARISYIPYDNLTQLGDWWNWNKIYDGVKGGDNGYLTASGSSGTSFTLDLKQQVKLSRIQIWHRWKGIGHIMGSENVMSFEMWGTDQIDMGLISDKEYWRDQPEVIGDSVVIRPNFKDSWVYLGYHKIDRVRETNPNITDAEILQIGEAGWAFKLPIDAPPVRYIRFFARSSGTSGTNPPIGNYYQVGELSFFGNNQIPQY